MIDDYIPMRMPAEWLDENGKLKKEIKDIFDKSANDLVKKLLLQIDDTEKND